MKHLLLIGLMALLPKPATAQETHTGIDHEAMMNSFGIMAMGMHHQDHHWMTATGSNPHG